jgi:integrase/recombinase XerD
MFYPHGTLKSSNKKEALTITMNQQTNENTPTLCRYQELNPEMDAFLRTYLEDGWRRGLRESSIHLHDKIGHYFLSAMAETGCMKPQEMNARNIGTACLTISSKWYLSHIRTFLRYAYQSGYTDRDYSGIVPRFKRPQPYPSVYTTEEILKIESSINQDSPHGKRDYAALLLATRLGIRSGDISSMTLECLYFDRNLIRITQHKTGIAMEFPMVPDVKTALERYLREERAGHGSPYVFLRIVPPYSHISVQAITKIVRTAIAAAGIDPDGRKQGAHAFRSSLASSMVNDNIPYEAVRKTLGHTDQNAIRSYARLDLEQLRGYALPVMEATGIFAAFLEGRWGLS